jgi:hypothetical protein
VVKQRPSYLRAVVADTDGLGAVGIRIRTKPIAIDSDDQALRVESAPIRGLLQWKKRTKFDAHTEYGV